jgi:phospholipid-binding lipoprotein MlaA
MVAVREVAPASRVGAARAKLGAALGFVALVADGSGAQASEPPDPLEPVNRAVLGLNLLVDEWALAPVAGAYRALTPEPVRRSVVNFLGNLRAPVVLANDILQGEGERAANTARRFAINSTLGVLGLFDPASGMGYEPHHEDFGQTLGVFGVPGGPYLVLPLLGPSNARDSLGRAVDYLLMSGYLDADALTAVFGATAVSEREANDELLQSLTADSLDLYATVRSAYAQKRAADIRNGAVTATAAADQESYDEIFAHEDVASDVGP